eukprot:CAMPEP_0171173386 /NCGR_PEP_ID=MMETSP0790-20130122/10196_1 /TAXON_ID=2925 /ORGANISM="Alexandrium catenella, Strain OF101" /LENGTH=362 /DNA_ID=CAMNT_0011638249 /DNA_START=67 /DNA_END=1156 /DNA_ORIENTATION=-
MAAAVVEPIHMSSGMDSLSSRLSASEPGAAPDGLSLWWDDKVELNPPGSPAVQPCPPTPPPCSRWRAAAREDFGTPAGAQALAAAPCGSASAHGAQSASGASTAPGACGTGSGGARSTGLASTACAALAADLLQGDLQADGTAADQELVMQRVAQALKLAASSLRERIAGEQQSQSLARLAHGLMSRAHRADGTISALQAELHMRRSFSAWAAASAVRVRSAPRPAAPACRTAAPAATGPLRAQVAPAVRHLAAAQPARAAFVAWRGRAAASRRDRRRSGAAARIMRRLHTAMRRVLDERVLQVTWSAWRDVLIEAHLRRAKRLEAAQKLGGYQQVHRQSAQRSRCGVTTVWQRPERAALAA